MENTVNQNEKICVWRSTDGSIFGASFDCLVGIGLLHSPLAFLSSIPRDAFETGAPLGDELSLLSKGIKVGPLSKVLILGSERHELGVAFEEMVFFGEKSDLPAVWKDAAIEWVFAQLILEKGYDYSLSLEKRKREEDKSSDRRSILFFERDEKRFACDLKDVDQIANLSEVNPSALVNVRALGFFLNLGKPIPVIDFGRHALDGEKVLIAKYDSHFFGFPVDRVSELVRDQEFSNSANEGDYPSISYKGQSWDLIKPSHIIRDLDLRNLCRSYEKIHGEDSLQLSTRGQSRSKAFIKIDAGEHFHIPIELVERVEKLEGFREREKHTSGHADEFPVFDICKHYSLRKEIDHPEPRVLVLKHNHKRLGVIVNAVESIIFISEDDILSYGSWIFEGMNSKFRGDVKSFVHAKDYSSESPVNFVCIDFQSLFEAI